MGTLSILPVPDLLLRTRSVGELVAGGSGLHVGRGALSLPGVGTSDELGPFFPPALTGFQQHSCRAWGTARAARSHHGLQRRKRRRPQKEMYLCVYICLCTSAFNYIVVRQIKISF